MRTQDPRDPTVPSMVVASPLAWQSLPVRRRTGGTWVVIVLVVVLLGVIAASLVHVPYYLESPGTAPPVDPLIAVDAGHRHPVHGQILLATVGLRSKVTPIDLVAAWLDSNINVVRRHDLTGGVSTAQFDQQATQEMDQSKQNAINVALRRLGYPEHGEGALVAAVSKSSPASGHLQPGDVVVAAGAKAVVLASDLTSVIRAHHPGDRLTLTVARPNQARHDEAVVLVACGAVPDICSGPDPRRPFLGVGLQTKNDRFDFPAKLDIGLNGVGGPSAGLAFTLGVINALSTGRITAGHTVAVTGTMELDGTVGPIGGIALKTVAVEKAGADVFLVPKDDGTAGEGQYSAAVAKARGHHLTVIAVGNLEDALNALRSIGGDLSGVSRTPPGTSG